MGNLASLASLFINGWHGSHYVKKGFTGGWSKWGGGRYNLKKEEVQNEWACQSCGKIHPKAMSPMIYQYDPEMSLRVCGSCYANNCIILRNKRNEMETVEISLQTITLSY